MVQLDTPPRAPRATQTAPVRGRRRFSLFSVVGAVAAIGVCVAIVVPLLATIPDIFAGDDGADLSAFAEVWNQPGLGEMLRNTLVLVLVSTALALVIASVFAWLNERTNARMGWLGETLPILPMLVPPLAGTIGWILLAEPGPGFLNVLLRATPLSNSTLQEGGPLDIYSWPGLIFVSTLYLVPHAYLVVAAALRNLDPSLEEASRVSGASEIRTLLRVTLPSIGPSIASGGLLAMVIGFAMFSVPVLIGTGAGIDILAVRVVRLAVRVFPPEIGQALVLGLVMLVFIGTTTYLQSRLARAGRHATVGGKFGGASKVDLGKGRAGARAVMLLYPLVTSVLPLAALVLVSLQPFWTSNVNWSVLDVDAYRTILTGSGPARSAVSNSVVLGIVGATVAIVLAALLDVYAHAQRRSWIRNSIFGITKLPGALSHIVVALALLATLAGPPIALGGTLTLLVIGYVVLYMPQASVSAGSARSQIHNSLVEASQSVGAGDGRTFVKVQLPLMAPGLAAGWVFVFVLMAGDLTGSVMLASTRTPVIGTVMLDTFESGSYPVVAALSVLASVVPAVIVVTVLTLTRRVQQRRAVGVRPRRTVATLLRRR